MSILLEALRKSEKKQRPHETPTIHTEVQSGSSAEPLRALPFSLMLVAVALLTGWIVWKQYRAPEGGYQPPVTLAADQVHRSPRPVAVEQRADDSTVKPNVVPSASKNRTPVESYQPPVQDNTAPAVAHTPPAGGQPPGADGTRANPAPAAVEAPVSKSRNQSVDSAAENTTAGNNITPATQQEDASEAAAEAEEIFHPGEPEPIGYWELPDAIRADVPEIKFSVLVYAASPGDRFVLVNGQRLAEGDSLKPGLVVKEIRRDGVVFSYRLYQFLVER